MSVLYCAIPHFAAGLARRDDPALESTPLVFVGPESRVFGVSAEAAACGVVAGMTARAAEVRCPEARLLDADAARCREEVEALLRLLEQTGPKVEPHGWGAAYVDLDNLARDRSDAIALCREIGRNVRRELGGALQPALGWDSSKFTAQAAARYTQPGHLRAVATRQERGFLQPLAVTLLPLAEDVLERLCFLGLRTLGHYAALPPAAVWQQFGQAGKLAHRCARGEDNRPIIPRWQALRLEAGIEFEAPLVEQGRLIVALGHLVSPLLTGLRENMQACGWVRLTVQFDDGSAQERERAFFVPTADEGRVVGAFERLLEGVGPLTRHGAHLSASQSMDPAAPQSADLAAPQSTDPLQERWAGVRGLSIALEEIQDTVPEQLSLFPLQNERVGKLQEVQRYLTNRFGANRLRRAVLAQPSAPLPEWRVSWQGGDAL
jgi:nucleotidyltransferase/DNA polymerase involved in DNA repair